MQCAVNASNRFPQSHDYPPTIVNACVADAMSCPTHSRTTTSTHGIRNCFFSKKPLASSNPLPPAVALIPPSSNRFLTPSIAALANEPPVPLIAVTAIPAVSIRVSVIVALPLKYDDAVSEGVIKPLDHRGSNQSAWKSKREKTRTKRRIEQ
jgi:hypothetical protein